ncbi:hypothetical protein [Streptomyces lonegramiae]|uniref:Uncharacterized protein n=2 Tax=Streptomyces TaxID=1883 RepID=A0ABU2XQQ7_9ACTN|nr:hypothetical protein [Streptomyces sp. DSM 41529]MDT0548259.1 hypothetical protein [Streptomyces sp. DSM 41529]
MPLLRAADPADAFDHAAWPADRITHTVVSRRPTGGREPGSGAEEGEGAVWQPGAAW